MTRSHFAIVAAAVAVSLTSASGVTVNLTNNNALNTSSFNTSLAWFDAAAPSAGNDYVTQGYLLRTPGSGSSYTFAGGSLTVGLGTGGGAFTPGLANNNAFLNKTPGTASINVPNLILNGSSIRDGQGSAENWTLSGNLLVNGVGGNLICQETFHLNSVISGSAPLYIGDNGSGEAARVVNIGSGSSTYNGTITMMGTTAARSRLTFIDNSLMNFTLGASGVNNAITRSGVLTGTLLLNGDFGINLGAAGATLGDAWTLVNMSGLTATYGGTFTVAGWSDIGSDLWQTSANGATYQFSEQTGQVLVVPEPSSALLLAAGVFALIGAKRRRA